MTVQLYEFGKILPEIQDSKESGYYYEQQARTKYVEGDIDQLLLLEVDI
jgi:hypothetical protein